jgi:hypothetical protein
LVWDLDDAVKEVKLLGEHEEEASYKIIELEALCTSWGKTLWSWRRRRPSLEGMIQSCDELIIEMVEEYGLNRMGENNDDEDEDNEGNAITPPAPAWHAAAPEEIVEEEAPVEMVAEQEAPMAHEVILANAESEPP